MGNKVYLKDGEFKQIGGCCYCLYCGEEVVVSDHYHDHGYEGQTHICDCAKANEAAQIRSKQIELNSRLAQLLTDTSVKKKLNKLKYEAAIRHAAIEFDQPAP